MVLGYFTFINKSVWVWFQAIFLPFHITSNIEPLDARGTAASYLNKDIKNSQVSLLMSLDQI